MSDEAEAFRRRRGRAGPAVCFRCRGRPLLAQASTTPSAASEAICSLGPMSIEADTPGASGDPAGADVEVCGIRFECIGRVHGSGAGEEQLPRVPAGAHQHRGREPHHELPLVRPHLLGLPRDPIRPRHRNHRRHVHAVHRVLRHPVRLHRRQAPQAPGDGALEHRHAHRLPDRRRHLPRRTRRRAVDLGKPVVLVLRGRHPARRGRREPPQHRPLDHRHAARARGAARQRQRAGRHGAGRRLHRHERVLGPGDRLRRHGRHAADRPRAHGADFPASRLRADPRSEARRGRRRHPAHLRPARQHRGRRPPCPACSR